MPTHKLCTEKSALSHRNVEICTYPNESQIRPYPMATLNAFTPKLLGLSQNINAKELKFWESIHPPLRVKCHVSHVTCHLIHFILWCLYFFPFFFFFLGQRDGVSWWRVCYQQGLLFLILSEQQKRINIY